MPRLIIIIFAFIPAIYGCFFTGNGKNPAPVNRVAITDGEFLVYGFYNGGEKTGVMNIVTRLEGNDRAVMYIDRTNTEENMPSNYTNYHEKLEISLSAGSIIKIQENRLDELKRTKQKGKAGFEIDINTNDMVAFCREYDWDGAKISTINSRMPLKKGYSYWDPDSIVIGLRFLDMKKNGIAYSIIPRVVKAPIPLCFKYYGDEKIDIPAGKFEAGKYGYAVADPFLGKLIRLLHDASQDYLYIEKSERGLLVETKTSDSITKLEKIGAWK